MVHPDAVETAVSAARSAGIPLEHLIVFDTEPSKMSAVKEFRSISDLVREGLGRPISFIEPKINARTKLAFLGFSSGTSQKSLILVLYDDLEDL